ncbi:MAG: hypothetical protein IJP03_01095 [Christensenellaceae bacterium]|nr:hypothetical protein [Christensenellaceae bacterium]
MDFFDEALVVLLTRTSPMVMAIFALGAVWVLIQYVFKAIALFAMASRRKIMPDALAWVPVANMWLLGKIADEYDGLCGEKDKKLRWWLLGCQIALLVLWLLKMCGFLYLIHIPFAVERAIDLAHLALPAASYIAMYKVYRSSSPDNATVFLVLSILLGLMPFFLFAIRKKDKGMPYLPE